MIKIILSSANMGDMTDEKDFDLWARYVAENCAVACGVADVEVEQQRFGEAGEDEVCEADENTRDAILSWLGNDGWEAFCAGVWQTMAANA